MEGVMSWEILDSNGFLAWEGNKPNVLILKAHIGTFKDVQLDTMAEWLTPATPWQLYKSDICYRPINNVWFKYTSQTVLPEHYKEALDVA